MQLRDYQTAATDAVFDWFSRRSDPTLVVLPTGSGKSLCIAALIRDVLIDEPGEHVLVLSHRREILQQDAAQLQKLIPHISIGVFSAGLGRKQLRQVTVAGIQSIVRAKYLPPFRLIIIDEAHLLPPSGDGIYRRVISRLLEAQPDARIVGYSATPFRQSGYLHEGDNALFAGICFEMPIGKLVDEGYLVPLVTKQTRTQADLTGVHMRGGEFVANEAEAAMDKEELTRAAVEEICRYGADRKSWLVFAAGVAHAEHVREELQRRGVNARSLFGHTDMGTRDRLLRDFKSQRLRCLVSVSTLTTGFDAPCTDLVAILRPIGSASLWVQCLGRGTRTSPETGKRDCIAEGSLVLTDQGLVPIEMVTTAMRVWDGCDWVSHCGIRFMGEREVITYAGLTATPDHKVWTLDGWKPLGECASKGIAIAKTGSGRKNIRECEGRFRRDREEKWKVAYRGAVHSMRSFFSKRTPERSPEDCGVSTMRATSPCAEMAQYEVHRSEAAMCESQRQSIRAIRRAWNQILLFFTARDGSVCSGKSWPTEKPRDRSHRQRQALRTWKPTLLYRLAESVAYQTPMYQSGVSCIQEEASRDSLRRQHLAKVSVSRDDLRGDCGEILPPVVQAKRRVWDILNAGPLHRFTAQDLLVSNCLVLDFAGCVARCGLIDDPVVRGRSKKGGEQKAPVKICPSCLTAVATAVRNCPECDYEWEFKETRHAATASATRVMKSAEPAPQTTLPVLGVNYFRHTKAGRPDSFRVEYRYGAFDTVSSWVCFEHPGSARSMAEVWWRKNAIRGSKIPRDVADALARTDELKEPMSVVVREEGKYLAVVRVIFDEAPRQAKEEEKVACQTDKHVW